MPGLLRVGNVPLMHRGLRAVICQRIVTGRFVAVIPTQTR